jgi:VWFA-related protein
MYIGRRCRRLGLIPLLLAALSLHSQTVAPDAGNPTTIKTKVRLALVDVVVTNEKGVAVTGLHKGDFQVLEDGKPQTISTFEEHHGAPPTQIKLPTLPPHVYTNFPVSQTSDAVNVLLLDAMNTPALDQSYVHSQMIKYLKTIPPSTRVAIFTLASRLRMLQGVTTDSSELLKVLNSLQAGPQQSSLLPSDAETEGIHHFIGFIRENSYAPVPANSALAAIDPANALRQFILDSQKFVAEARVGITLQAMQQLARYLAGIPGRKNVIWFSGSFPLSIFPDPSVVDPFSYTTTFGDDMRKTADLLTAAQVAIYPIASEGLAPDAIYQANANEIESGMRTLDVVQDQLQQTQTAVVTRESSRNAMEELAKNTGGQAFYNTNGFNDVLTRVVNNGTRYYSLAYSPSDPKMDGKYRRIQVKLLKGKGTLAYRRGYYADDLETVLSAGQKPEADPLLMLMGRNLPEYSQILYKVKVLPSDPQPVPGAPRIGSNTDLKGPLTRYGVDFAISPQDLKLEATPDGVQHGSIEIVLLAYDSEGKPLNFVVTKGDVNLDAKVYESVQKVGLQIHKEIDVPREYVYLRTGIYDLRSNAAGTLGVPLTDAVASAAK